MSKSGSGKMKRKKKKKKKTGKEGERGPLTFSQFITTPNGLLRKDYNYDQLLSISTKTFRDVNISARIQGRRASVGFGTKFNSANAGLHFSNSFTSATLTYNDKLLPFANVSAFLTFPDYKNSKVSTTLMRRGNDLLPTELIASLTLPDDGKNKVNVQCLHRYTTFAMAMAFKQPTSILKLSSTIGTQRMAIGMEATYQTSPFGFTDWQAGFRISNCRSIAALIMADKGDHYRVSCLHHFDSSMQNAVSAEICRKLSDKTHTFAVGGSCMIDHLKLKVKGKVDNHGKIEALIQHKIKRGSSITICCEYNIRTLHKIPRIGIAAALTL